MEQMGRLLSINSLKIPPFYIIIETADALDYVIYIYITGAVTTLIFFLDALSKHRHNFEAYQSSLFGGSFIQQVKGFLSYSHGNS